MASGICPVTDSSSAHWRPAGLPVVQLVGGVTRSPAVAWVTPMLSPVVIDPAFIPPRR